MPILDDVINNYAHNSIFQEVLVLRNEVKDYANKHVIKKKPIHLLEEENINTNFICINEEAIFISDESWKHITTLLYDEKQGRA